VANVTKENYFEKKIKSNCFASNPW
jgi:hypothetical protein